MKWKLLVAVALVLVVLGLLFFTEQGRKYATSLGSLARGLVNTLGSFVGSMVKVPGKKFNIEMNLNKEALYGQNFSFSDKFEAFGKILSLSLDGKTWEIGEDVKLELTGTGEASIGNDGKVRLKAEAKSLNLNSWKTSDVKIETELLPKNFLANNVKADLLSMSSVTGNVSKKIEDVELKIDLNGANLKIEGFLGTIEFNVKSRFVGSANNLEINGKKV
jgi:uncharacterized protein YjeT (DUF2065 family)